MFLTGADQLTYEVYPEKGTVFPAHRILIADNGIYIVENMNLEELGQSSGRAERTGPLHWCSIRIRLKGMTGSPLNAFAVLQ